ncbi:MAG: phage terminase large subunit [Candidatus Heimdallarchaeaceae archaeon]
MKLELTAKQALAYLYLQDNKTTELGFGGGAGGGKSILGCFWILQQALEYPGTAWLIGRRELTNLKKTTLISFFEILQLLKIKPSSIFTMNQQTNILNFHNGSRIFLMDMSKQPSDPLYTRFGGLELTGAFVDESNENEELSITILKTRIGRKLNKKYGILPKILETFNPQKNHIYYRYYKPSRDNELPKNRVFIKSLATDNYYLDENYINQLKNADKITKERLLYGNFEYDDDPTRLFEYDAILDMFTNNAERGTKYCIVDVAGRGRDRTITTIWDGLFIEKIYNEDNISSDELDERLKKYKIPRSKCAVDEDGVGYGLVKNLPGVKGFVNNARPIQNKKETDTQKVLHNYANLKAQCWFELANYVNSGLIGIYRGISVQDKKLLIEDLEQIKQKDPGKDQPLRVLTKEEIKEVLGRSTDIGDAVMMRMFFELKTPMAFSFISPKPVYKKSKEEEDKEELERQEIIKEAIEKGDVALSPAQRRKQLSNNI